MSSDSITIREVWNENLEEEFKLISNIIDHNHEQKYVAMDTEFPGLVVGRNQNLNNLDPDARYQILKKNVDHLKLIQLGLTFSDVSGNLATCGTGKICSWQFTFREFDIHNDPHSKESIELLTESGIDFGRNLELGVDAERFRSLLMTSGVMSNPSFKWVVFQGAYDFAYLCKLLSGKSNLPESRAEFLELMKKYFPVIYDIKYLAKICSIHSGLGNLATSLDVERVGTAHQAGSDSLLTCRTFWAFIGKYFGGSLPVQHAGKVHGIGEN
ncbi:hypothetical protein JCGZ_04012 [Jatropha curcas]|uniref:poly(A)-specific ribonuclease n=1 Tax=Jatropha curcas TaxID=180498 RepID=A0A067L3J9_JATCU|nr:probable CCR4-associated factor 1 homolog 6 [Jatropha curcas]KDP38659.1 hypothetical protein JCGZ_04012 [Jatropha curcas]